MIACHQEGCDNPPSHRYTWPQQDERLICLLCAAKVNGLASAIGLRLQFIPLTAEDYFKEARDEA